MRGVSFRPVWKVEVSNRYISEEPKTLFKTLFIHGGDRRRAAEVACEKSGFEFPVAEFVDIDKWEKVNVVMGVVEGEC